MDDVDILAAVKDWSDAPDPVLAKLSQAVLQRRLLKCATRVGGPGGEGALIAFDALMKGSVIQDLVQSQGYDSTYDVVLDRPSDVPYGRYYVGPKDEEGPTPILVDAPGHPEPLDTVSDVIGAVAKPQSASTLYVPAACVPAVRDLLHERGVI